MLAQTGADGVMIGRAALGRPWIFAEVSQAMGGEMAATALTLDIIRATVRRHMRLHFDYYEGRRGAASIRKHLAYYLRALPDPKELLPKLLRESDPKQLTDLVEAFFEAARLPSTSRIEELNV